MSLTIAQMFDRISGSYDGLNHLFSLNIDRCWRRQLVKSLTPREAPDVLDCCTGTGDQAFAVLKRFGRARVTGIDVSEGMLSVARRKTGPRGNAGHIGFVEGDIAALPFADESFDVATMSFGLRNLQDRRRSLGDVLRVLRPGGELRVTEFSPLPSRSIRLLYEIYLTRVIPRVGGWLSREPGAYRYLAKSVQGFLKPDAVEALLRDSGFRDVASQRLTGGIACLFCGSKPVG